MHTPNAIPSTLVPHLPTALQGGTYTEVHTWGAENPADFWTAIWAATQPHHARTYALARLGSAWFIGSKVNLTAQVLEAQPGEGTALLFRNELIEEPIPFERAEQYGQVASMAAYLRDQGIGKGDTVGVYLPVVPEALFALYAAWAVGAQVCYCGIATPVAEAADQFAAAKVELLIAADGYRYGGKAVDRMPELEGLQQQLAKLRRTVLFTYLDPDARWDQLCDTVTWLHTFNAAAITLDYRYVGFNQDAWVTGTQKLEQGGLLLTALKYGLDFGIESGQVCFAAADKEAERLLWAVRVQLCGGVPVLFDGRLDYPNNYNVWKTAKEAGAELVQVPVSMLTEAVDISNYLNPYAPQQLVVEGGEAAAAAAWVNTALPHVATHAVRWDSERSQLSDWTPVGEPPILEGYRGDAPA